jgi:5-methylcytosine-specific restriction protein A
MAMETKLSRSDQIDTQIELVAHSLGIQIGREILSDGQDYDYKVRIANLPAPYGFAIAIGDDYLSWSFELVLDSGGIASLHTMQSRFSDRREIFFSYVNLASERNKRFKIKINGKDPIFLEDGESWRDLRLNVLQSYSSEDQVFESLYSAVLDIFCILLCLLVEQEVWTTNSSDSLVAEGVEEGAMVAVVTNRYERSRYNRALCLRYYGFKCRGCGQLMEKIYGPIGQNVIHVHHIVPISRMGGSYVIDPIKDLIPLCPNCHNVVHRQDPPLEMSVLNSLTGYNSGTPPN